MVDTAQKPMISALIPSMSTLTRLTPCGIEPQLLDFALKRSAFTRLMKVVAMCLPLVARL